MAKSFFERLTGSIRVQEEALTPPPEPAKPAKIREAKQRKERARKAEEEVELVSSSSVEEDEEEDEEAKPQVADAKSAEEPASVSHDDEEDLAEEPEEEPREERVFEVAGDDAEGQLTLDVFDDGSHFVVQSTVAGVKMDDLDISINGDTLSIRGVRRKPRTVADDRYYTQELYWGKFSRALVLPEDIDSEKVDASLKDGLLVIKIPKKRQSVSKKVRVRTD